MTESKSPLSRTPGFRTVGVACGLKKSQRPDLALVLSDQPCAAAGVFTRNSFKAAPLLYDIALLEQTGGRGLRGVVINAGNANAVTGAQGQADAAQMARLTEAACDLPPDSILVLSTGVIGQPLPMSRVEAGIELASQLIQTEAGLEGLDASRAIMTTDLVPKEAFTALTVGGRPVKIGGMAKGSGMIHPDMATLLGVIVTDAALEPAVLQTALQQAVEVSFNRISVDGDTSTNDTIFLLASGQANHPPLTDSDDPAFETFVAGLTEVCLNLAKAVARDGEGATKLVEITVRGAASEDEAVQAAKTVATSPLMKTALFGNDPNWGRALMAIGYSGAQVDPGRVSLWLGDFQLVEQGEPLPFDDAAVSRWLADSADVSLVVDLGVGPATATVWTCDLSYKYVEINAEYHT